MALKPVSVSQLNEYIARIIGTDPLLMNVSVTGELSGVKYHSNGHVYFSLVDDLSKVDCVLWHDYLSDVPFELMDGQSVTVRGSVNVFKRRGSYNVSVRSIELLGAGDLSKAFEEMKEKLAKEGLFDKSHKKPLPFFPENIAVVTAETGAAVKDILKIIKSRNDVVNVFIYPVSVQGDGAAQEIADAVTLINRTRDDIDLMIVGRGGGSQEDLQAFNEEVVARSIFASEIPVISAVGHEIDYSISDMVADVRAETPTAAAEMAVPDTSELREELIDIKTGMLTALKNEAVYKRMMTENIVESMTSAIRTRTEKLRSEAEAAKLSLDYNDPRNIMKKGYSVVRDGKGRPVTDTKDVNIGEELGVMLAKGSLTVKTTGKEDE